MTAERLENLRVIEGRMAVCQSQLDALGPDIFHREKRASLQREMAALWDERDAVYSWIESIPKATIANAIALRYAKCATWEEIGEYMGGMNGQSIKRACLRYIWRSEAGAMQILPEETPLRKEPAK